MYEKHNWKPMKDYGGDYFGCERCGQSCRVLTPHQINEACIPPRATRIKPPPSGIHPHAPRRALADKVNQIVEYLGGLAEIIRELDDK